MADKKLETFKIGDASPPGVKRPAAPSPGVTQEESPSLGFARLENLLEEADPVAVGKSLNKLHQDLERLAKEATTNRAKTAAQKAIAAVERAVDLMDYLFQTKASIEDKSK